MADGKKIYFSIPDFYHNFNLNMNLLNLMKMQPELFMDDIVIDSVYGSFPGCIWNSGRGTIGMATYENIVATVKPFNEMGVSVRHTFTSSWLDEKHINDYYCNRILEITSHVALGTKTMNGVNISSPRLERHIAKNYPDFYRLWSTTKQGGESVKTLNELSADRIAVMHYSLNNNESVLKRLKHPENVEVLVSEACVPNCPNRQTHYQDISSLQKIEPSNGFRCPFNCEQYFYYELAVQRPHYVSPEAIREVYLPLGINQFKIGGRNDNVANVIENYVVYFVKPEHRDNVRNKLLVLQFSGAVLNSNNNN